MEKVYVVMQSKSEDYHGSYETVLGVKGKEEDARAMVKELESNCYDYNICYYVDIWNVE